MGGKKKRITSKIDELPEDIRIKVDFLLADTKNSYEDISQFLKEQGYMVSKSSVGRYALRSNTALQRLMEAFPKFVWLNPEPTGIWEYRQSIALIQQILGPERMFPLTLQGLEGAMKALSK